MFTRESFATYNPAGNAIMLWRARWDQDITTLDQLASVTTAGLTVPAIRAWIQESTNEVQCWELRASTAATADGVQRPTDFDAVTNAKVWFRADFPGGGTGDGNVESLYANSTMPANVGTSQTAFLSYTLPAGKLANDGDRLRITCIFKFAFNVNFKTPRVFFGSQTVAALATTGSSTSFGLVITTIIRRISATTQEINSQNNTNSNQTFGLAGTQDLTAAVVIHTTGQSDTASDDITQREMIVEYLPAPL